MNKFRVEAKRIDQYEIEIDPEFWNAEYLERWSEVFHKVNEVKEIAEDLSFSILRLGSGSFIEGFGYVKTLTSNGREVDQYRSSKGEYVRVQEEDYCPGIIVRIIDEDDEHEFDTKEVENEA